MMEKVFDPKKAVLGLDTGLSGCTVGVYFPATGMCFEKTVQTGREQAARLVPMVQAALQEAGIGFESVGLMVAAVGPGSFTGLRIGMTTATMMALARNCPTQGVGTMAAMVETARERGAKGTIACVLETKRSDYYLGIQDGQNGTWRVPPVSCSAEDIGTAFSAARPDSLCGDALDRLFQENGMASWTEIPSYPSVLLSAKALCRLGYESFCNGGYVSSSLEPQYLRGADITKSNKAQRVIADYP